MNCQKFKSQIDHQTMSAEIARHLENCLDCRTFKTDRECLQKLVKCLEQINAPTNFEFGVRAKLQNAKPVKTAFGWGKLIYAAPALAVLIAAFVLASNYFRPPQTANAPVAQQTPTPIVPDNSVKTVEPQISEAPQVAVTDVSPETSNRRADLSADSAANQIAPRPVSTRKNSKPAQTEHVKSVEGGATNSSLRSVQPPPIILNPAGIPNERSNKSPLALAKGLLEFNGIFTEEENGELRVVRVAPKTASDSSEIQSGDVIQAVNGQKLSNVTGASVENLTIKRGAQTREIKLVQKP